MGSGVLSPKVLLWRDAMVVLTTDIDRSKAGNRPRAIAQAESACCWMEPVLSLFRGQGVRVPLFQSVLLESLELFLEWKSLQPESLFEPLGCTKNRFLVLLVCHRIEPNA